MEAFPKRLLYTERVLSEEQQDTGVRVLHLNKPDTLNSLTTDMASEFTLELQQLQADKSMRALIVTGEGRAFSAGGDFNFIEERIKGDKQENTQVLANFYKTFLAIRQLPVVTIAAINGPAVGGGMGFAMACDIRIASTAAKLSYNFVKLGITPGCDICVGINNLASCSQVEKPLFSKSVAAAAQSPPVDRSELLEAVPATMLEALRYGLLLDVVEPDRLLPAAKELAGRIAAAAPGAVSATLQMLRLQLPWGQLEEAAELEAAEQAAFFAADDIKEGLAAVREKRLPKFRSTAAVDPQIQRRASSKLLPHEA
eukprot:gene1909-2242_t